jgi:hypothetical protein
MALSRTTGRCAYCGGDCLCSKMYCDDACAEAAYTQGITKRQPTDIPPPPPTLIPNIRYSVAHDQVKRTRGRASEHSCADCGRPASDWSYNHDDPDEFIEWVEMYKRGNFRPAQYSSDPAHYSPRCKRCHTAFDRRWWRHQQEKATPA